MVNLTILVTRLYIIFLNCRKSYFFSFKCTIHNKTKILVNQKHYVRVPLRMKLAKNPVFHHNFSKFTGILLFWNTSIFIFPCFWKWLVSFPDQLKIMVNPFKISMFWVLSQNYQHFFQIIMHSSQSKLSKKLKTGIGISVGQAIFKLWSEIVKDA